MIADVLQSGQGLQIAEIALGDLPALGVARQVFLVQDAPLRRKGEVGVEAGPVDLVAQFEAGEHDALAFQLGQLRADVRLEHIGIGRRKRPTAPQTLALVGVGQPRPLGAGVRIDAEQPFDLDPVGVGALRERQSLVVAGYARPDDVDAGRLQGSKRRFLLRGGLLVRLIDEVGAHDRGFSTCEGRRPNDGSERPGDRQNERQMLH